MRRTYTYLPQTLDAARVLGLQIAAARRRRRMTLKDLAERARIDEKTLRKVEQGDPTVATGTMFEVAGLVGVSLFAPDPSDLPSIVRREEDRLALLPSRIVKSGRVAANDF
ncbi:MAG TPA: helix-turn-helix transcriptional regulator [Acidimicrobiales bacterium]|jgi:transcriptional regulator with XRE-family HTH domain|nr:helix-turn-helix transcriptional regulator [Acidimicrobiales bacterium]